MDLRNDYGLTLVTLSQRNLRDLLAQLSSRAEAQLVRFTDAGRLIVRAEEDDVHYERREPGRGSGLLEQTSLPSAAAEELAKLTSQELADMIIELRMKVS